MDSVKYTIGAVYSFLSLYSLTESYDIRCESRVGNLLVVRIFLGANHGLIDAVVFQYGDVCLLSDLVIL